MCARLVSLLMQYFDGGDAWFTPIAKIFVDQTAFAASWNTLYYVLLGEKLCQASLAGGL